MKVFLLAAGEGTRLRPLTLDTPKCLVPVSNRPLIEYWFDLFERYGIDEVLINTSYMADVVENYIKNARRNIKFTITYEKSLLGSGGTIKKNWSFVNDEEVFCICYADNLTNINLQKMREFHERSNKDVTLALFEVPNPRECGIVKLDEKANIISFTEKPEEPESNLAFGGIMLSDLKLKNFFPEKEMFDLGYDILPQLIEHAAGYAMDEYLLDIGTLEKLQQAERDIKNNIFNSDDCRFQGN